MKYCRSHSDIPTVPHWAIITSISVYIPGDERSQTNPGHGYPATTEHYCNYHAYLDEGEWKRDIEHRVKSKETDFVALKVFPAKVETSVTVKID